MYKSELEKNKQEQLGQAVIENKVILVGGRPFELQEELQKDKVAQFV